MSIWLPSFMPFSLKSIVPAHYSYTHTKLCSNCCVLLINETFYIYFFCDNKTILTSFLSVVLKMYIKHPQSPQNVRRLLLTLANIGIAQFVPPVIVSSGEH